MAARCISPQTIRAIRTHAPGTTIEILTPDFLRKDGALKVVVDAKPDVFNHNLETVPSLYLTIRPGARYFHSLRLLQRVKELDPSMFTKSGIMVGLGEERNEILQVMDDLRSANVDFLTIGQYLQPTRKHAEVKRFVPPDEFKSLETIAYAKGFLMVSASPLTRSSHHAGDDFAARLNAAARADLKGESDKQRLIATDAAILHQAPRPPSRAADMFDLVADVEKYPQFVPLCTAHESAQPHAERRGHDCRRCRHDGRLQVIRQTFTSRVTLDRPNLTNPGRISRRSVQPAAEPLDLQADRRQHLRGRVLHRLRIQEPHARHADGRDVRHGVPQLRRRVRETRRRSLRTKSA